MTKIEILNVIARARSRLHHQRESNARGHVAISLSPTQEAQRLGITEHGPVGMRQLLEKLSIEATALSREHPVSVAMSDRAKRHGKPRPAPPQPAAAKYVLTAPVSAERGSECVTTDPNTIGIVGYEEGYGGLNAFPQQPDGDAVSLSYSFDPPAPGLIYVTAMVTVSGTTVAFAGSRLKLKLTLSCSVAQVDSGISEVVPLDLDTSSINEIDIWSGVTYTLPAVAIGVEKSSATVGPVSIRIGGAIFVDVDTDADAARWNFCPGFTVGPVVVDYAPWSDFVIT